MLRHIIFDCDGVLWQGTNDGYFLCYHRAAIEAGIEIDCAIARERILQSWGQSARIEVEGMIPEHPDRVDEVVANYRRLVRSDLFLETASLVPGVRECFEELGRDHRLSVVTGMNGDNLGRLLDRFGLRGHLRHAISTSDTDDPDKQKPTGYHLRRLLQVEGLDPQEVLCVGDAASDILMAQSQSVPIVIVLTGHLTEAEALARGVTDILPSVADLPAWIQKL
ncbi:MAG TPA: HAD family hydrolase [Verrucomicrobiae bacterium]|nr:HAD family hydrolase [Verrucomicrobiae bacterium]